jgi:hypothetical protein
MCKAGASVDMQLLQAEISRSIEQNDMAQQMQILVAWEGYSKRDTSGSRAIVRHR